MSRMSADFSVVGCGAARRQRCNPSWYLASGPLQLGVLRRLAVMDRVVELTAHNCDGGENRSETSCGLAVRPRYKDH